MADKFTQLLPLLGALVAFLLAALLLVYIFRLVFGKKIRAPGARNRPRRLDVVDVFDLDKERQLVIVRRDNTEHLLLIGGPNDVLVEATINRVEAAGRPAASTNSNNWPAAPTSPAPVSDAQSQEAPRPPVVSVKQPAPLNLPPDLFASKTSTPPLGASLSTQNTDAPLTQSSLGAGAPARPTLGQLPPIRPTPPAPRPGMPSFLSRTQRIITPKKEDESNAETDATPPVAPKRPMSPAAPPPPPPPQAKSPSAPPPPPPVAPKAPPPFVPPAPASDQKGSDSQAPALDPLESLEEEMARLLGRPDKD